VTDWAVLTVLTK